MSLLRVSLVSVSVLFLVSCEDREVPPPADGPNHRDLKKDLPRPDLAKLDLAKLDLAKPDLPKPDLPKPDAKKLDAGKLDLPKAPDLPFKVDAKLPPADLSQKLDYSFPVKDGAVISSPVDILFVIDNSNTMEQEQTKLAAQFPALIDALKLAGTLPDLHIGVVSTDLGAGNYGLPSCEVAGGDGGKLQNKPTSPTGCATPTNPWISHANGVTNIPSGSADPAQRVKDAFSCIATIGTGGCGFENTLEAAKRALDPALNVNPGFLRANALLAIVFVTDEDDCSAASTGLYDPSQQSVTDPLGPLSSFRCARFGYTCNPPIDIAGAKTACTPSGGWLHTVASYVSFFKGLKPAGKVFLSAIAGPSSPITVGPSGNYLDVMASCQSGAGGTAMPALRIHSVLDGIAASGNTGLFNFGISPQNTPVQVSICSSDYAPAMRLLGLKLAGAI